MLKFLQQKKFNEVDSILETCPSIINVLRDADGQSLLMSVVDDIDAFNHMTNKTQDFKMKDNDGLNIVHSIVMSEQRDDNQDCEMLIKLSTVTNILNLINEQNDDGRTPFHYAAIENKPRVFQLFLERFGADVNIKDKDDSNIIHLLVKYCSDDDIFCQLLNKLQTTANIQRLIEEEDQKEGRTPLLYAAKKNHLEPSRTIKLLVENFSADVNATDADGDNIIHSIVGNKEDDIKTCQMLNNLAMITNIDHLINEQNKYGRTPLRRAVLFNYPYTIQLLIEKFGADVNAKDNDGSNFIHILSTSIHEKNTCETLQDKNTCDTLNRLSTIINIDHLINEQNKYNRTPIYFAVDNNKPRTMELLVEKFGADVNLKDKDGSNIIHFIVDSCKADDNQTCEMLRKLFTISNIENLVNDQDKDGETPLHIAAYKNKPCTIELLLKTFNIDLNLKNDDGKNIIHGIVDSREADDYQTCEILIKLSTMLDDHLINGQNIWKRTPIFFAAKMNKPQTIELLLKKFGADVNVKDKNGSNIIHWIVESRESDDKQTCEMLKKFSTISNIQHLINDQDKYGETPLHIAAKRRSPSFVEFLCKDMGADLNVKDYNGKLPGDYNNCHEDTKRLLENLRGSQ